MSPSVACYKRATMPSKPTEVEVPDGEFTLTYVRGGRRASSDALVEHVRAVLAPWKGRLAPSTLAPDALTDRTWLWVVRLSDNWWAVATNAPVRDALARRLATRLRTSAVWFRRQAGTAAYELRYGTAQPEGRHDAEIRARQTLPVLEARQFLVSGAVTVKETPAHAALRAIAKCRRGHRNTLDLTVRMMEDPDLDVDVELVDPEHRQAPRFFEDLRADALDDAEGWVRLADGRPTRQRILWARRCEKCAAPVYGAVEWDGCLRRVRALPKRPASFARYHVLYDPGHVDPDFEALRARATAATRERPTSTARDEAPAPISRAAIDAVLREADARGFYELLTHATRHGPRALAREAVERLLAWDDAFYAAAAAGKTPQWPLGLSLAALLDFEGTVTPEIAARVAVECLRLDLPQAAERCFALAAPLTPGMVDDLRRRVKLHPFEAPSPGRHGPTPAALFEAALRRHAR